MLSRLSIRNYALIDNLDISFSPELNILTGETGAGKSIILGALSLILGQRTDSRYFFNQQKKCIIEGFFEIEIYALADFFKENDLDYETDTVLRREIAADGRSRAFINDTPVNLAVLKQLGERLIDIHSQHATLEINDQGFQLLVVDALAGHAALLEQYRRAFADYRKASARLKSLDDESRRSKADLDYVQFQFDELESAALREGEQEQLEQELALLTHAEEIKRNLSGANYLLNEEERSVIAGLKESLQFLQQAARFAPEAGELSARLESAYIELKDIAAEAGQLESRVLVDDARLAEVNDRVSRLYQLQQKHRVAGEADLIALRDALSLKLRNALSSDEEIEALTSAVRQLVAELTVLSDTLSASRSEIIPSIEQKVKILLAEVGMPNAVLKIENVLLPDGEFDADGRNSIRFLFAANKGQDPAPMNKVASGGELSRLMLSIKSLISMHTALPTIIFDEIDTGISGETALKVGAIMEKLAGGMQVIAITHLPQIASKGNAHYKVYKDDAGERTLTNIALLQRDERVREIATMLSGSNPGEFALQHANELLGR